MGDEMVTVELTREQHGKIIWKLDQLADLCLDKYLGLPSSEDEEQSEHFRSLADAMRDGVIE